MDSYVFDTHAILFALSAPKRLGKAARSAVAKVEAGKARGFLPAAVVAEVCLLRELGRVQVGLPELEQVVDQSSFLSLAPLDRAQLREFSALSGVRDPFDRLILSAARALSAILITKDVALSDSGLARVVWD